HPRKLSHCISRRAELLHLQEGIIRKRDPARQPARPRRRRQLNRLRSPLPFGRSDVRRMRAPEFLTRKTTEKVIERLAKPTRVPNRIISNDKRRRRHFYPRRSVAVIHDRNPRNRPAHARGRSGRNTPCRKLASSLKNWTSAHKPMWPSAAYLL